MLSFETNKIKDIAYGIIKENQDAFRTDDTEVDKTYILAYNDGVLDFLEALLSEYGEGSDKKYE